MSGVPLARSRLSQGCVQPSEKKLLRVKSESATSLAPEYPSDLFLGEYCWALAGTAQISAVDMSARHAKAKRDGALKHMATITVVIKFPLFPDTHLSKRFSGPESRHHSKARGGALLHGEKTLAQHLRSARKVIGVPIVWVQRDSYCRDGDA